MRRVVVGIACSVLSVLLVSACGGSNSDGGPNATAVAPKPRPAATSATSAPLGADDGAAREGTTERDAVTEQTSTFALDVDTASYGYARRAIEEGRWPEPGQVRIEEFVNAFDQDYAQPEDDGFAVHVDGARLEGDQAIVRVGLQTRASQQNQRKPANLTFVVDVSGSMSEPGRLDLVRDALHTLVDQLLPGDQVAIVAFSSQARLVTPMTPVSERSALHAAISELTPEESTNLAAGLVTGYREASGAFRGVATNRVIVLSDGLANSGSTEWQGILTQVADYSAKQITLLCVGVGREYGDELMEQLADNGDGAAVYVSELAEARKVFVDRLPATLDVRARDAKAQVVFNPGVVESYSLLGYENRALSAEQFRDDSADGGEVGPGHAVTALYWVKLREGATGQLGTATVRWLDPDTRHPAEAVRPLETSALTAGLWSGSPRFQVDVAAAALAERLRLRWESANPRLDVPLADLESRTRSLADLTEDPAVRQLADLIGRTRAMG